MLSQKFSSFKEKVTRGLKSISESQQLDSGYPRPYYAEGDGGKEEIEEILHSPMISDVSFVNNEYFNEVSISRDVSGKHGEDSEEEDEEDGDENDEMNREMIGSHDGMELRDIGEMNPSNQHPKRPSNPFMSGKEEGGEKGSMLSPAKVRPSIIESMVSSSSPLVRRRNVPPPPPSLPQFSLVDTAWILGDMVLSGRERGERDGRGVPVSCHRMRDTKPFLSSLLNSPLDSFNPNLKIHCSFRANESGDGVSSMISSPSEFLLFSGSNQGAIRCWDLRTQPVRLVGNCNGMERRVLSLGTLDGGRRLCSCDGSLGIWDIETFRPLSRIHSPDSNWSNFAFSSFNEYLHTSPSSKSSSTPRFSTFSFLQRGGGFTGGGSDSGDSQVIVASSGSELFLYDLRCNSLNPVSHWILSSLSSSSTSSPVEEGDGSPSSTSFYAPPTTVSALSSESSLLYAGSNSGQMWVIDPRTGRSVTSWYGHSGPVLKVSHDL